MKSLEYICLLFIGFALILGCSGNNANIRNLTRSESEAIQQELIDNWSDYDISYNSVVIVFDFKNDDKKILVGNYWSKVKDQETWTQLVNGTATSGFRLNRVWGNEVREIWIQDNQFYGYVTHQQRELVSTQIVDENSLRIIHTSSIDRRVWD